MLFPSIMAWACLGLIGYWIQLNPEEREISSSLLALVMFAFPYIALFIILPGCCGCCQSSEPGRCTYRGGCFLRFIDLIHSDMKGEVLSEDSLYEQVVAFNKEVPRVFLRVFTYEGGKRFNRSPYVGYYPVEVISSSNTTAPFAESIESLCQTTYRPIVVFDTKYHFTNDKMLEEMRQEIFNHFSYLQEQGMYVEVAVHVEEPGTNLIELQTVHGYVPHPVHDEDICRRNYYPNSKILQMRNEQVPNCGRRCCRGCFYNSFFLWLFSYLTLAVLYISCWKSTHDRVRFVCSKRLTVSNKFQPAIFELLNGRHEIPPYTLKK